MTDYRAIVGHASYWRGKVHRWSTSYSFTGSGTAPDTAACQILLGQDDMFSFYNTAQAGSIGAASDCRIYLASGGVPVAEWVRFDWRTVADWENPDGTAWGGPTTTPITDPIKENALQISWPAGLGSTGKPVYFRKYFHQVPQSAASGGGPDISSVRQDALVTRAQQLQTCLAPGYGLVFGNARRIAGTVPVVNPYYVTHQMPRGRRRPIKVTANGVAYRGSAIQAPGPVRLSAD